MVPRTTAVNYHLKSGMSITHRCQLCSTRYTALQIKNCLKSTSAIKVPTMKKRTIFIMKESHHALTTAKSTPFAVTKDHKGEHW